MHLAENPCQSPPLWSRWSTPLGDTPIKRLRLSIQASFTPTQTYQGYDGIVHGGIISALLDEAMAKLAFELGYNAITAMLTIRFKNPAKVREKLTVRGEITHATRRLVLAKASIRGENGALIAEGDSKLVRR